MTHDEKIQYLLKDLGQRGIGPYTVAPPIYRLLWALGIEAKPPHFAAFWLQAAWMGASFAVIWGVFMWLAFWRGQMPAATAVELSAFAGLCFGVAMAAYYQRQLRKLALPRWEDYPVAS